MTLGEGDGVISLRSVSPIERDLEGDVLTVVDFKDKSLADYLPLNKTPEGMVFGRNPSLRRHTRERDLSSEKNTDDSEFWGDVMSFAGNASRILVKGAIGFIGLMGVVLLGVLTGIGSFFGALFDD